MLIAFSGKVNVSLKGVFESMTVLINKLMFFVSWLSVVQSKGPRKFQYTQNQISQDV